MSNFPSTGFASRPAYAAAETTAPVSARPAITLPPEPNSVGDTGLSIGFLSDLLLKHVYLSGMASGQELADEVRLPFLNVVDQVLMFLRDEELVEITGSQSGYSERSLENMVPGTLRMSRQEAVQGEPCIQGG